MKKLAKVAGICALLACPSFSEDDWTTGSVAGDIAKLTKEILGGIGEVLTPEERKQNEKRIVDQVLSYYEMHFMDFFSHEYKDLASELSNSISIDNLGVNRCSYHEPHHPNPNKMCLEGNVSYNWSDERIPEFTFGFKAELDPLSGNNTEFFRNYNINIESIIQKNSNINQITAALDYYYKVKKQERGINLEERHENNEGGNVEIE